jgi:hypothetical protein
MERDRILEALKKVREENGITTEFPTKVVVPRYDRPHKHNWGEVPDISDDPSKLTREAQGIMNES